MIDGTDPRSSDALFVTDRDLTIVSWNEAAAHLTGVPAEEAVGRPCWFVIRAMDEVGGMICHAGCSNARLAIDGWNVRRQELQVRTTSGRERVSVSTITLMDREAPLVLHVLTEASESARPAAPAAADRAQRLTPRQTEVLELMAEGVPARQIAARLSITITTTRNHIRAILAELDSHSQLEAIATARRRGIL